MLRKVTLGLIAAASLGAAALAPSAASAGGFGFGFHHHHFGHHHHWGHGYGFGPSLTINTGIDNCLQQRMVETRRSLRLRSVNVCAYRY